MKVGTPIALVLLSALLSQGQAKNCKNNPEGNCINLDTTHCNIGHTFTDRFASMEESGCVYPKSCCAPYVKKRPVYKSGVDQCGVTSVNMKTKIVGGVNATIVQHPWMVSLQRSNEHDCGGSLINDRWVLTAAHCVLGDYSDLSIQYGSSLSSNLQATTAERITMHGKYVVGGKSNQGYDIALIKLKRPIKLGSSTQRRICLPDKTEKFQNRMCVVTGWGDLAETPKNHPALPTPLRLQQAVLPLQSHKMCKHYYRRMPIGAICAGYKAGGVDACKGDSGGPLVCLDDNGVWKQAGIVSFGAGCGRKYSVGIYTDVAYFRDWIDNTIKDFS